MDSVCLVTGISAGIGKATAVALVQRGVRVVGVVRNAERGRGAVEEIRARVPAAEVDLLVADLGVLDDVRRLAEEVRSRYDHLDVLLHNAGVAIYGRRETTADGYERTFATNHLAPYLLTRLLVDRLEAAGSKPARVVSVSSQVHRQVRQVPWDDLQSERSYSGVGAYNLSKLANVLFARALAERLDRRTVVANAVSPGFVHTDLNRGATLPFRIFFTLMRPLQRSPQTGAETSVWAATAPQAAAVTGEYFEKCRPAKTSALAQDRAAAERMWAVSAELCGLTR
jgi:NAD(P)-dependent dehydrogenase (short-subunit alcohol dehydrogenase family)